MRPVYHIEFEDCLRPAIEGTPANGHHQLARELIERARQAAGQKGRER